MYAMFDRFELRITKTDARMASHQGQCDDDVRELSQKPYIARQLAALDAATVRDELRGYGAWDDEELADHAQNLQRVLWLGAGQILDS